MKRILFSIFCILAFSTFAMAQLKPKVDTTASKYSFNLSIGSSISSINGSGPFLSTYIAPQIQYNYNSKFSFGGGVIITNSPFNTPILYSNEKTTSLAVQRTTQSLLFVNGTYHPTDRLSFTAMAYKSLNVNNESTTKNQLNAFNNNMQGFLINMNYKITEHSSINVGFNYSEGGYNPFYQHSGINAMGSSGFNPMYSW
jgi:hypothetical protein